MMLKSTGLALISIPSIICAQPQEDVFIKQMIGSWEGTDDKGKTAIIQFQPGGRAQVIMNGERLVPDIRNGPYLKFKFDQSKSPIWLDFIAFDKNNKETGRIKFLVKFITDKSIWIESNDYITKRPEKITEIPQNGVLLTKLH